MESMTTTARRVRNSFADKVTFCPTCERTVGVWWTSFNSTGRRTVYGSTTHPKISAHHGKDGRRCPASGWEISPNVVMERDADKTAS